MSLHDVLRAILDKVDLSDADRAALVAQVDADDPNAKDQAAAVAPEPVAAAPAEPTPTEAPPVTSEPLTLSVGAYNLPESPPV